MKKADALYDDPQGSTAIQKQTGRASAFEENSELWDKVSVALKNLVSGDAFSRWFSSAYLKEVNETEAVLGVVSDMHQVWIETNYLPEVQAALASVSDLPLKVRVVVCEAIQDQLSEVEAAKNSAQTEQDHGRQAANAAAPIADTASQTSFSEEFGAGAVNNPEEQIRKKLKSTGLNPQFSFCLLYTSPSPRD